MSFRLGYWHPNSRLAFSLEVLSAPYVKLANLLVPLYPAGVAAYTQALAASRGVILFLESEAILPCR
jgi:hypothetical protein